jgi:hypothetical protein
VAETPARGDGSSASPSAETLAPEKDDKHNPGSPEQHAKTPTATVGSERDDSEPKKGQSQTSEHAVPLIGPQPLAKIWVTDDYTLYAFDLRAAIAGKFDLTIPDRGAGPFKWVVCSPTGLDGVKLTNNSPNSERIVLSTHEGTGWIPVINFDKGKQVDAVQFQIVDKKSDWQVAAWHVLLIFGDKGPFHAFVLQDTRLHWDAPAFSAFAFKLPLGDGQDSRIPDCIRTNDVTVRLSGLQVPEFKFEEVGDKSKYSLLKSESLHEYFEKEFGADVQFKMTMVRESKGSGFRLELKPHFTEMDVAFEKGLEFRVNDAFQRHPYPPLTSNPNVKTLAIELKAGKEGLRKQLETDLEKVGKEIETEERQGRPVGDRKNRHEAGRKLLDDIAVLEKSRNTFQAFKDKLKNAPITELHIGFSIRCAVPRDGPSPLVEFEVPIQLTYSRNPQQADQAPPIRQR